MDKMDMLEKVANILREEFDDDDLEVTFETSAADIPEWDSLAHLSLIHEVEASFQVKFTIGEIQEFKNVGDMINSILKYLD